MVHMVQMCFRDNGSRRPLRRLKREGQQRRMTGACLAGANPRVSEVVGREASEAALFASRPAARRSDTGRRQRGRVGAAKPVRQDAM